MRPVWAEVGSGAAGSLLVVQVRRNPGRTGPERPAAASDDKVVIMSSVRTVVVSGGGTGIGRAVARRLAGGGQHVTVTGRRRAPLDRVAAASGLVDVVAADVSTVAGAESVAARIRLAERACAGVVAAAGGLAPSGDAGLAGIAEDWQESFESNVLSAVLLVEAMRADLEAHAGRVVLLSSVAALRGSGGGPYGAMKAALHAWAFDLASDLGRYQGTANVIAPGFVPDTEFWAGRLNDDIMAQRSGQTLVGRPGTPDEVASLIAWLLGPDGGWVTGQVLSPNGGVVLGR
jgi:3-oxoacyl-[acyl-carrier protein] reductase